jgi:hypothetical protein
MHARVSGAWQIVKSAWANVGGTWQRIYAILSTTITVGNIGGVTFGFSDDSGLGLFGSVADGSYDDATLTTRNLEAVFWDRTVGGAVSLYIDGTSVPNNDSTFTDLEIAGLGKLARSAASYSADILGNTRWLWTSINTSGYPNGSTASLVIRFK